jgi:hypothetical protein
MKPYRLWSEMVKKQRKPARNVDLTAVFAQHKSSLRLNKKPHKYVGTL